MLNVKEKHESDREVPFAMLHMQAPSAEDRLHANMSTLTTVYTTFCGPQSSPDDGAVANPDD